MTSQEFWFSNPQDYFVYQDAFAEREKNKHDEIDIMAWQFGKYNLLALSQSLSNFSGKKHKNIFPQKPITMSDKVLREDNLAEKFKRIADRINKTKFGGE